MLPETLAGVINQALAEHQQVVWLLPGGSNVPISVAAMRLVDEQLSSRLVLMQTDERFVALNSPDCNWHQLLQAGLEVKQAKAYPILADDATDLSQTVANYATTVQQQFEQAEAIIGQFGIGPDGHIAGILPGSPAVSDTALVAGYHTPQFTRVTLTPVALKRVTEALAFAFGDNKKTALQRLQDSSTPLDSLPSGILWQIPTSVVYNDQIEN